MKLSPPVGRGVEVGMEAGTGIGVGITAAAGAHADSAMPIRLTINAKHMPCCICFNAIHLLVVRFYAVVLP